MPAFTVAPLDAPPDPAEEAKSLAKAEKKALKKALKKQRKERMGSVMATASAFPMTKLIEENIKAHIPKEVTDRIEAAPGKKHIIGMNYPYEKVMKSGEYEEEMELLQIELVKMQTWVQKVGHRIVLVFEGRDAAGKGGTILRFNENLNPRNARVVALAKPSEPERGQWYFQRSIERFPTKGEIVFFDRSWYNRTGVEHVMGCCQPQDYLECPWRNYR